ncbi:hypothetical protein TNCT_292611 [Trichonephila clavata]|uniref:Transposase n=1 Tax=Trichonephila clavata TaxID=2740835 RepID=A0A8X6KF66_TRICU|nr:hypothetical protein TNCT_292611 [Trichonephila clavata]
MEEKFIVYCACQKFPDFFVAGNTGWWARSSGGEVGGGVSKLRNETGIGHLWAVVEAGSRSTQRYLLQPLRAKNGQIFAAALCNQVFCVKLGKNRAQMLKMVWKAVTLPQPPYSTDLAPAHFFLFQNQERNSVWTLDAVKAAFTTSLKEIPVDGFQGAFND